MQESLGKKTVGSELTTSIQKKKDSQFNDWSFGTKRSARSIAFATPAIQI